MGWLKRINSFTNWTRLSGTIASQEWPLVIRSSETDHLSTFLPQKGLKWRLNHRAVTNVMSLLCQSFSQEKKILTTAPIRIITQPFSFRLETLIHSHLSFYAESSLWTIPHGNKMPFQLPSCHREKCMWKPKAPSFTLKTEIRISFNSGSLCSSWRSNSIPFLLPRFQMSVHNNTCCFSLHC